MSNRRQRRQHREHERQFEPMAVASNLEAIFQEIDGEDRRRWRERPLNRTSFDAIDRAVAPGLAQEGR